MAGRPLDTEQGRQAPADPGRAHDTSHQRPGRRPGCPSKTLRSLIRIKPVRAATRPHPPSSDAVARRSGRPEQSSLPGATATNAPASTLAPAQSTCPPPGSLDDSRPTARHGIRELSGRRERVSGHLWASAGVSGKVREADHWGAKLAGVTRCSVFRNAIGHVRGCLQQVGVFSQALGTAVCGLARTGADRVRNGSAADRAAILTGDDHDRWARRDLGIEVRPARGWIIVAGAAPEAGPGLGAVGAGMLHGDE